jgi:hypothetical protein
MRSVTIIEIIVTLSIVSVLVLPSGSVLLPFSLSFSIPKAHLPIPDIVSVLFYEVILGYVAESALIVFVLESIPIVEVL